MRQSFTVAILCMCVCVFVSFFQHGHTCQITDWNSDTIQQPNNNEQMTKLYFENVRIEEWWFFDYQYQNTFLWTIFFILFLFLSFLLIRYSVGRSRDELTGGVGKSSLVLRFIKGTFRESYIPTIEDTYRQVRFFLFCIACDRCLFCSSVLMCLMSMSMFMLMSIWMVKEKVFVWQTQNFGVLPDTNIF